MRTGRHTEATAHAAAADAAGSAAISSRLGLLVAGAHAVAAPQDRAAALFDHAIAVPRADRWPFDLARVHLLYGEHLRRTRATTAARTQLAAAQAASSTGCAPGRGRPAPTRNSAPPESAARTPREPRRRRSPPRNSRSRCWPLRD